MRYYQECCEPSSRQLRRQGVTAAVEISAEQQHWNQQKQRVWLGHRTRSRSEFIPDRIEYIDFRAAVVGNVEAAISSRATLRVLNTERARAAGAIRHKIGVVIAVIQSVVELSHQR